MRFGFTFSLLLLATAPFAAHAGAWVQPAGKGLFISQFGYFESDKYYDASGDKVSQSTYRKYEYMPYVEYGVTDTITVGGTASLQHDRQSGSSNTGIADPEIFLRTAVWKDAKQVVSLQPLVKVTSLFEDDSAPRGGSTSTDLELSALYGRSVNLFGPNDYLDLRAGYRHRLDNLNDQVRLDALLGLELTDRLQLIPAIRSIISTGVKDTAAYTENGEQDYTLVKMELGVAYKLDDNRTIGMTVFDHVEGRQTGNGKGVLLGYALNF